MSTIGQNSMTLLDHAKMLGPDGKSYQRIIEMMQQDNDILTDLPYIPTNKEASHQNTIRTGLPPVYWKRLGRGTPASKSLEAQVEDATATAESWSEVEDDLAQLGGNPAQFRLNKAQAHLQAMGIEIASTLFYGSANTPEEFIGLSPRYSDLSAPNKDNIVDCGGIGNDNTSIWLLGMGEEKIHGLYARNFKAGIERIDHGKAVVEKIDGAVTRNMVMWKEQFKAHTGVHVADWRFGARAPNIDVSNLRSKEQAADIMEAMIKMIYQLPNGGSGAKLSFYMNKTVALFLDLQARDVVISGGGITFENVGGKRIMNFRGIKIGICDAILNSEDRVI